MHTLAHHAACSNCQQLEQRNADLEERIALLESELGLTKDATLLAEIKDRLGLKPAEAALLQVLYSAPIGRVTRNWTLLEQLPSKGAGSDRDLKIIDVYICRIRKALRAAFDIDGVETVHSLGYRLSSEARLRLSSLLEKPQPQEHTHDCFMEAVVAHERKEGAR